jgi:hypothetical protein
MSAFELRFPGSTPSVGIERIGSRKVALKVAADFAALNDVFLQIDYVGDRGLAFIDGALINDDLFLGRPWELGLRSFAGRLHDPGLVLVFHPIHENYGYLGDLDESIRPVFHPGRTTFLDIRGISCIPEYKAVVALP